MTDALAKLSTAFGWLLRTLIRVYQLCLSSVLPPSCRFTPTCSDYACQAIVRHGPLAGIGLAVWRILRCNPWNAGGDDPVPARLPFGLGRDPEPGCRHGAAPHNLADQR